MLNAYIDDSGSVGDRQISAFTLTGYVFTAHRAMLFGDAWQDVLRRYRLPYIYTREAIRLDGPYAAMQGDVMNACLVECAEVIKDHAEFELSCIVETNAWKRALETIDRERLIDHGLVYYASPYFLQYMSLIQMLHHYKLTRGYRDDACFFFDEHNVNMQQVASLYRTTAESAPAMLREIGISNDPPEFFDDKQLSPLQAADMGAYTVRRLHDPASAKVRPFEHVLRAIKNVRLCYDDEAFASKLDVELAVVRAERLSSDRLATTEVLSWLAGQRYAQHVRENFGSGLRTDSGPGPIADLVAPGDP